MTSSDIFKNFVSVIKPVTGFKIVGAFIDDFILDVDKKFQDQIVINPPLLPAENYTFDSDSYNADSELLIEIYSTSMRKAVETYDLIQAKILDNKDSLIVQNIRLGTGTPATFVEGSHSIKVLAIPVSFDFRYSR